jgi:hypothetical protein
MIIVLIVLCRAPLAGFMTGASIDFGGANRRNLVCTWRKYVEVRLREMCRAKAMQYTGKEYPTPSFP